MTAVFMNFDAWTVDLKSSSATHESGFRIDVEGNPKDPSAVNPGRFPGPPQQGAPSQQGLAFY